MAYSTGSYANVDDALDLLRAFCLAYGWTINDYSAVGSRYRLHIQKTINGNTCYFNFKSCVAEVPFTLSGYATLTGIACNGSLGYSGALAWNAQPGYTNAVTAYASPGTSFNVGGNITLDNSGGTYFFFDNGSTISAAFTSNRSTAPYQLISFGATDLGIPVFACSGGRPDEVTSGDARGAFLASSRNGSAANYTYQSAAFDGTGWCIQDTVNNLSRILANQIHGRDLSTAEKGQYAQQYLKYSPSPIRGNAPLPPCALNIVKDVVGNFYSIGTLAGIFFVNMTNYTSEDEITLSSGTYKLFKINTTVVYGVAFKK